LRAKDESEKRARKGKSSGGPPQNKENLATPKAPKTSRTRDTK